LKDIKNASNNSVLQINTSSTIGNVLNIFGTKREDKKF
jgi:hypothetical protein